MENTFLTLAQVATQPSETNFALWGLVFLGLSLILAYVEMFIPSGGIIGLVAAVIFISGIVMIFMFDTTLGLVSAIAALIAVPFFFVLALKIWPNTPIAKMLLLKSNKHTAQNEQDNTQPQSPTHAVGATGTALTDLHPVGTCLIDGQRIECLSESGLIDAETPIHVVSVDGMQIKVRPVEDESP